MRKFTAVVTILVLALALVGCTVDNKTTNEQVERLGFVGANVAQGGLMAGDGEWVYYRDENDWSLCKARTDGSDKMLLLPGKEYTPSSINVLDDWIYFANYRDGFSIYRVQTDGTDVEKLVDGYCSDLYVAESGIYFDWRDECNNRRLFRMNLDGSEQKLISSGCVPEAYYNGVLYFTDYNNGSLSAYDVAAEKISIIVKEAPYMVYCCADETGIYYWHDTKSYRHLDPNTGETTVLRNSIGDYYNCVDGTLYFIAYGGENYAYRCCYAMDLEMEELQPILSLSDQVFDFSGNPIGITMVDYRTENYDPALIPVDDQGWDATLDEMASSLYVVNGQVFTRGTLQETMPGNCWVLCDGTDGTIWGE